MSESRLEISVGALASDAQLTVKLTRFAGEGGLDRPVRHPRVQKSGLALAGHFYGVVPTRVQVLGETELSFLDSLSVDQKGVAARGFFSLGLSCVVVTRSQEPARALVAAAEATSTPLYVSDSRSSRTINALHAVLDDRLAPQTQLHGVLVDVFGVGLLLVGKSGIGKSECALELVLRGHRLVADDVVRCDWRPPGMIFGEPADLLRHHIEMRGLGVLNIQSLFGVTSVRERKRIDVVVRLVEWSDKEEYDRLGLDQKFYNLLGTPIRELTVPVRPGRDMGSILEIAARNELLRRAGTDAAREFLGKVERQLVTSAALEAAGEAAMDVGPESMFAGGEDAHERRFTRQPSHGFTTAASHASPPTARAAGQVGLPGRTSGLDTRRVPSLEPGLARSRAYGPAPGRERSGEPGSEPPSGRLPFDSAAPSSAESLDSSRPQWSPSSPASERNITTESSAWIPIVKPRKEDD